jgi:hypothetical protein
MVPGSGWTQRLPSVQHLLTSIANPAEASKPCNELHYEQTFSLGRQYSAQDLRAKTISRAVEWGQANAHYTQVDRSNAHLDFLRLRSFPQSPEDAGPSPCEHVSNSPTHGETHPKRSLSEAAHDSSLAPNKSTSSKSVLNDFQTTALGKRRREKDVAGLEGKPGSRKPRNGHTRTPGRSKNKPLTGNSEQLTVKKRQSSSKCPHSLTSPMTNESNKKSIRFSEPVTKTLDSTATTTNPVLKLIPSLKADSRSPRPFQSLPRAQGIIDSPLDTLSPTTFSHGVDPYSANSFLTEHYCKQYFVHFNSQLHNILSQSKFMPSIEKQPKLEDDLALLYAVMALGAKSSTSNPGHDDQLIINIAQKSLSHSSTSLEAVQARAILSALNFLSGDLEKAQKWSAVATRTAFQMLSSARQGMTSFASHSDTPSDYSHIMQTCLAVAINHCFQSYILPVTSTTRLTSESGLLSSDFHLDFRFLNTVCLKLSHDTDNNPLLFGRTPLVAKISTLFADVAQNIEYPAIQTRPIFSDSYESLYRSVSERMRLWNLDAIEFLSVPEGCQTGLHLIYHFAGILLNRHVRHELMTAEQITRNWMAAHRHAVGVLTLFYEVLQDRDRVMEADFATSWPFGSYVLVAAVDIVTATGAFSDILGDRNLYSSLSFMDTIHGTMFGLQKLAQFSEIAKHHLRITKQRFSNLLINSKIANKAFFSTCGPLYSPFGVDRDIAYGLSRVKLLHGMGLAKEIQLDTDLYEIRNENMAESSSIGVTP